MVNEILAENQDENQDQARLKQYKNLAKHEDMRRRRTECSVELRKQKRDDMMMKRRNLVSESDEEDDAAGGKTDAAAGGAAPTNAKPMMPFKEVIAILQSHPNIEQTRDCFESIRRALSKGKAPPVDEVINCGLMHACVQALTVEDDKVQFEAAWAITNIVSGNSEQTTKAVEAGVTPPLVALTMHSDLALAEQAMWAVANIAGDSAQLRDYVIQCQGVEALLALASRIDDLPLSFVRTLAWSFSNMCRHKNPHASIEVLRVLSQGLAKLIAHPDKATMQDACWAVSYLTDGPDEQISLAKDAGLMPSIVALLGEKDSLVAPALRVLGNIATGNDVLTQSVIDAGVLHIIPEVVRRTNSSSITKECCWLISNVIAGTQSQIQAVINAGLLPLIINVLQTGDFKCQFECSWALSNLVQGGTQSQLLEVMADANCMSAVCAGLVTRNVDFLTNILEVMHALLTAVSIARPDKLDAVKEQIEEANGLDNLEKLQENEAQKVYDLSYRIISEFFSEEDDEEILDENSVPTSGYAF